MQFPVGYEEFLVTNVEQYAERLVTLLKEPALIQTFGASGRAKVEAEFLLPRLLRDELQLFHEVLRDAGSGVRSNSEARTTPECALSSD